MWYMLPPFIERFVMKNKFFSICIFSLLCCIPSLTIATEKEGAKTVSVFLVGAGGVGGSLLDQIAQSHDAILEKFGIDIRVVGLANTKNLYIDPDGIVVKDWRSILPSCTCPMDWEVYCNLMVHSQTPSPIFVDCTSDAKLAGSYPKILHSQIGIVTPNKKANSAPLAEYGNLREAVRETGAAFLYDANVGAALPIISAVQGIIRSGDQIEKIEAVLSGTLSFLFNSFAEGISFSEIVLQAQNKGYTEPDPRDDLNGMDFARKLLILAREAGYPLAMEEIDLQRFLPDDCFDASSVDDFYLRLKNCDPVLTEMRRNAEAEGKRLRFIGSFENGKGMISLQAVGPDHPFYSLSGTDNIISIKTRHYSKNPLVIRGPGAGTDLTASRVLEGIVRIGLEKR